MVWKGKKMLGERKKKKGLSRATHDRHPSKGAEKQELVIIEFPELLAHTTGFLDPIQGTLPMTRVLGGHRRLQGIPEISESGVQSLTLRLTFFQNFLWQQEQWK